MGAIVWVLFSLDKLLRLSPQPLSGGQITRSLVREGQIKQASLDIAMLRCAGQEIR